ncbi:MAG: hypothetical protein E7163_01970 [Firmicutes bacterium]|nr:hypothetical protein [Bacillota bacterium]
MALNKHGWGLVEMLLLSSLLIIFLLIAAYLVYILYGTFERNTISDNYISLEEKLEKQTLIYLNDYYDEDLTSDKITITRSVLKSYDLDISLLDSKGNACSGYTVAYKTKGIVHTDAYIKCDGYMTEGYEDWRK